MNRFSSFFRLFTCLIIVSLILTCAVSCKGGNDSSSDESGSSDDYGNIPLFDIAEFSIVRDGDCSTGVTSQTARLKDTISSKIGISLKVSLDDDDAAPDAKEILIGQTNRVASEAALTKLSAATKKEAFIIDITDNAIVIVGSTEAATERALKVFINNYVLTSPKGTAINISAGKTLMDRLYSENRIIASSGTEFELILTSTVFSPPKLPSETWGTGVGYPTIIELQHSGENNGILFAANSVSDSGKRGSPTSLRVSKSIDGGKTWALVGEAYETFDTSIEACWNPHLFELPEDFGAFKKGTLLLAGCSIDSAQSRKSHLPVWYSTDLGATWTQISVIDEGGGDEYGVWEPYLFWDNGYLYCFYSDDSGEKHDQSVVYKRTKDGIVWSDYTEVVAAEKFEYRPGMGIVTKMGNGKYFIVYEIFGDWNGCPIYYKTTDDITVWNPSDIGTKLD